MAKKNRNELRSSAGKKLYAVRDQAGKFEDIQSYQLAHAQDMKRVSQDELAQTSTTNPEQSLAQPVLADSPSDSANASMQSTVSTASTAAPKKNSAKKATAKKVTAKKATAKKVPSKKAVAKKGNVEKTVAKKQVTNGSAKKKLATPKTAPKQSTSKKSVAGKPMKKKASTKA